MLLHQGLLLNLCLWRDNKMAAFDPFTKIAADSFLKLSETYRPNFQGNGILSQLQTYPNPLIVGKMDPQLLTNAILQNARLASTLESKESQSEAKINAISPRGAASAK